MNILQNTLSQIGLSEMEIAVYLAALELGEATMQELAQKSTVKRATIYTFIEKLKQSGLILQAKRKKRTLYIAAHPQTLLEIEKRKTESIAGILPDLLGIYNHALHKPRVTFFEGKEGILSVYDDTLREKKPIQAWSDFDAMQEILGDTFMTTYPEKRTEKNIYFHCITRKTDTSIKLQKSNAKNLRDMRFMTREKLKTEVNIYGNKVAFISFRKEKPFAVIIEDEGISETLRSVWSELWHHLEQ